MVSKFWFTTYEMDKTDIFTLFFACVYRSRGALVLDNRRDFTQIGQTDFVIDTFYVIGDNCKLVD